MQTIPLKRAENLKKQSSTRRHAVRYGGEIIYISDPLKFGNHKLSKEIAVFDLLAVHSCTNCKACARDCYALKAQRARYEVWDSRAVHTYLARHDLVTLRSLIVSQMRARNFKAKIVRIHSAGDFLSQEYFDMWKEIAREFRGIAFYTYTKAPLDFGGLPSNFNIVRSVLPDGGINFGSEEYVKEKARKFNAVICPYGTPAGDGVRCGVDCTLCLKEKYVLFYKH